MEDLSEGSGEPEEVSEEEEVASGSPLLAGSCMCVMPVREPLEVGENEDCSQAVSPGTPGTCSCGGIDGEDGGKEETSESVGANGSGETGYGSHDKMVLSKRDTGAASLVSLSSGLLHSSSISPPSSPLAELCPLWPQTQVRPEFKPQLNHRSPVQQEEFYRLVSTDSTSKEASMTLAVTPVSPLMASSPSGDLYLEKTTDTSSPEQGQGLSWRDARGNKLSSVESELLCSPESLHSQLAEPTLTSGWLIK